MIYSKKFMLLEQINLKNHAFKKSWSTKGVIIFSTYGITHLFIKTTAFETEHHHDPFIGWE